MLLPSLMLFQLLNLNGKMSSTVFMMVCDLISTIASEALSF